MKFLLACFTLLLTIPGQAALITQNIDNLDIGGVLYDVTLFQDNDGFTSFNQVYGNGAISHTFDTQLEAQIAAQSLFDYAVATSLDLSPFQNLNGAFVTYFSDANSYDYLVAYVSQNNITGPHDNLRDLDNVGLSFARFQLSAIPEPSMLALMAAGLAGIVFTRRRRRLKAGI